MEELELIFGRSYQPISVGIQIRTWCWWSHVGIVRPGRKIVLEARGGFGVVDTPMEDFKARYRETALRYIYVKNLDDALSYANSRKGLGYDHRAFWGIAFGLDIHDLNADQCAELVANSAGIYPAEFTKHYVPKTIWRLSHAV